MGNLTFFEGIQLLLSTGVFAGGLSAAGWVLRMERRVSKLEIMEEIRNDQKTHGFKAAR